MLIAAFLVCALVGASAQPSALCTYVCSFPGASSNLCKTVCAPSSCNAKQTNYGGDVLVLNLASFSYPHGGAPQEGSDPGSCCAACRTTDGCNTWSLCNAKNGCGAPNSCKSYLADKPTNLGNQKIPALNFGPFSGCTPDGRWPTGMCSLKVNNNTNKPAVYGTGAAAEGFIGGVVPRKAFKPGCPAWASNMTCTTCLATKNPGDCFSCALNARYIHNSAVQYCAACANLTDSAVGKTCLKCITTYGPGTACSGCVKLKEDGSMTVDAAASTQCFACVNKGGPSSLNSSACANCFGYGSTQAGIDISGCLSCASAAGKSETARSGCAGCYDKAVPASSRPGCLACTEQKGVGGIVPGTPTCGSCAAANIAAAGLTNKCYKCVATVNNANSWYCGYLSQPIGTPVPPAVIPFADDFYACLAKTGKSYGGATNCEGCLFNGEDVSTSKQCFACATKLTLSSNANQHQNAFWCEACWRPGRNQTLAAMQKCQQCLVTAPANQAYKCAP